MRARNFKIIKRVLTLPPLKNHTQGLLNRARAHYGSADYNAAPEVLAAADYVSCSNDEDGVAAALKHFGLC